MGAVPVFVQYIEITSTVDEVRGKLKEAKFDQMLQPRMFQISFQIRKNLHIRLMHPVVELLQLAILPWRSGEFPVQIAFVNSPTGFRIEVITVEIHDWRIPAPPGCDTY